MRKIQMALRRFEIPRLEDWVVSTDGVGDVLSGKSEYLNADLKPPGWRTGWFPPTVCVIFYEEN